MGRLRPIFHSNIAEGRFPPPENGRPHFWYVDASLEPPTKSSNEKKVNSIPSSTVNLPPGVKEEVDQIRSMLLLVMEELVNTESSYLRILSQFIALREEMFAPNWRADQGFDPSPEQRLPSTAITTCLPLLLKLKIEHSGKQLSLFSRNSVTCKGKLDFMAVCSLSHRVFIAGPGCCV
ncbi:unnamed protein product [Rodentolepis nana]|uniref:DH domain-containing protein n=1 Tax=Rodentolepis nana TaxID=102285 RepID=A0A0R3TSQ0_RODNA|nr:unnamed protein product [Rodentolepis nana]